ncbi:MULTISPECIES: hypothetical protein [unclassified Arthrobacter]|uniref:hypothetical protein n=1 Tax=unclassified Arthrobacter TaxID=235627 RepID=UPI002E0A672C|nr:MULTISPECIES: hypothetical protein [unclassified Arthrobacter]MEC5190727.1 hypothetical protein [Arthrobacter sp. MP_M4]MEC5202811.1 hypothetical protein [Arthrobacter sp. MP_M7]
MAEASPAGSGAAPVPAAPVDGVLQIRGGVGGLSFQFEELLAGASALDGIVHELAIVEVEADRVRRALFPYQFDSYSTGSAAITAVGEAGRAIGSVRMKLERLCRDVRASHRDYESAEARNTLLLRIGLTGAGYGPLRPLLGLPPITVRDTVEDGLSWAPAGLAFLLGLPAGVAAAGLAGASGSVRSSIRALAAVPELDFLRPRSIRITGSERRIEEVDVSPAGLLLRAEAVGRTSGEIEVLELGNRPYRAWVVVIPGTQLDGLPQGTNPFDAAGIAEGLGFDSTETGAAIREALAQAGAESGDQVAAVGYSQGGIHAMNLSRDKAFLADYDLKFVLTAGSPVGAIEPAAGTSTLHLEHEQDWVPGADGVPNPDTKDRVTVTVTTPIPGHEWLERGLGPGHDAARYAEGAREISASRNPSLETSTAALTAVVGAGGTAGVTRFSLRRETRGSTRQGLATAPGPSGQAREERWPPGTPR